MESVDKSLRNAQSHKDPQSLSASAPKPCSQGAAPSTARPFRLHPEFPLPGLGEAWFDVPFVSMANQNQMNIRWISDEYQMNQEVGKVGMCPRVLRFASGGSQCCTWCLKHALFVKCTMKALKKVWKFMQFLLTNTEICELSCTACFSKSTSSWWHVCYCLLGPLTTTILFTCVHRQQPCWRLCQGSCALKAYSCRLDILFCRTCFRVYCDEDYQLLRSVMGLGACKVTPGVAVAAVLFLTNARIIPDNPG